MTWILPSQLLSACAAASGCSISALTSPSAELVLWATSSGKPAPRPSSWSGWKTRPWSQRLFSQALSQPSHGASFADWWTSSLRDSRVRQSASQENDSAQMTTDGSGPESCVGSRSYSRASLSSKTCPVCALAPERELVAYAAGLIDGEGSISIGMGQRAAYPQFNVAIHVEMATKHHHALNAMVATMGGTILPNRQRTDKHAATLSWRLHGPTVACALTRLLPYLRSKARVASEVLELLARDSRRTPLPNGRIAWTEERIQDYTETRDRVVRLNQRGPELTDHDAFALLVGNRWVKRTNDLFGERLETYSGTWPRAGIAAHGRACGLTMWARTTKGNGSSSSAWPTPDAQLMNDGESPESFEARRQRNRAKGYNGNGQGTPLAMAARMWPTATAQDSESTSGSNPEWGHGQTLTDATRNLATPRSEDSESSGERVSRGVADTLSAQSRNWATPNARDHKGSPTELTRPDGKSRMDQLDRQAENFSHLDPAIQGGHPSSPPALRSPRRLNPAFGCWLMGWPSWWTNVGPTACARSEMASYLSRLRSLCEIFCADWECSEVAA